MTRLVLGVIGHVDHGKTALVRALTGTDTDRLPEEKRRGISIALGFAHLPAGPDTVVDLIDMPGHERFVRTMIAGATGIDAVLLVVAANEGVQPQTVEHVDIAGLLGLRRALVAVTKSDLVPPDHAARIGAEAVTLLRRAGLDPLSPLPLSALTGDGVEALRAALAALAAASTPRPADGVAFLPIDRAFTIPGHGTVVTGTLRGAPIAPGDTLDLLPACRPVRVRATQVHGARVPAAQPGQRIAVNLRGLEPHDIPSGAALAAPGALAPSAWLTVALRAVPGAPTLRNGARLRALLGTAELDARLRLLDRDTIEPGDAAPAQLHLAEPVAIPAREHVILRRASPAQTVAGGLILEPETPRRRRRDLAALERLDRLRTLPPPALVADEAERAGTTGTTLRDLSRLSALAAAQVAAALATRPVLVTRSGLVVPQAALDALLARIPSVLQPHRAGLARDKLLAALPGTGPLVLDEALARLLASGTVRGQNGLFSIPRPEEERAAAGSEARLAATLAETLRRGGLAPPDQAALASGLDAKRALDRLVREGVIVRAHDSGQRRVVLFHQDAVADAQRRLRPLLSRPPGLLVNEVGTALGISRKFSVPLLEHLNSIRWTRRIQDRRILAAVGKSD